ncbi:hypothetical protein ACFSUS_27335 [Spirosoma soli]|uniref:Lipoprotein n=1 Tax=Spirosoma soli TaxID=1770529 RepID=A0ABW5MDU8_9BACT
MKTFQNIRVLLSAGASAACQSKPSAPQLPGQPFSSNQSRSDTS